MLSLECVVMTHNSDLKVKKTIKISLINHYKSHFLNLGYFS